MSTTQESELWTTLRTQDKTLNEVNRKLDTLGVVLERLDKKLNTP